MPQSARYQQRLNLLPQIPFSADQFSALFSAKDFKQRLLTLISQAKTRIYIAALYIQDDEAGREIMQALHQAKQHNPQLDIKLLVDFHRAQRGLIGAGGQGGNHLMYQSMEAEYATGIEIYGIPVKSRELLGVLHLKGFVFDDTLLYSGASINDIYLHQEEKYRFDRYHEFQNPQIADSFARFILDTLAHPAVQSLCQASIPSAKKLGRAIAKLKKQLSKAKYKVPHQESDLGVTPLIGLGKRGNRLNKATRNLLLSAQKEIFICTPYFNLPGLLARDIKKQLLRGVKVTIVIGDKTANDFYIPPEEPFNVIGALPYIYESNLRRFAQLHQKFIDDGLLNLMLWQHDRNSYHLKGIFVDDNRAMLTGSNLNPRAWARDLENGLLIHDKRGRLQTSFEQEKQNILTHSTRIARFDQLEALADYPEDAQKVLKRIQRFKAHLVLKNIL